MGCYSCDNCGKKTESYDTGHCDVCGYGEEEHICEDCWEEEVCVCDLCESGCNHCTITEKCGYASCENVSRLNFKYATDTLNELLCPNGNKEVWTKNEKKEKKD